MLFYKKKKIFRKLGVGMLLASVLGFSACAGWRKKPLTDEQVKKYSKEGMILARKGHLDEAQKMLEQVLDNDSDRVQARFVLGEVYVKQNKNEDAIKILEDVRSLYNTNPDYFQVVGRAYFQAGNKVRAEEEYKKALAINPRHAVSHNALGDVFKARGELDMAEESYRKALKIDPNLGVAHYSMGLLFEGRRQYQKALSEYKASVNFGEKSPDAYYHLGLMLDRIYGIRKTININDYEIAAQALEQVLIRDSGQDNKNNEVAYLLGVAYLNNYLINKSSSRKDKFLAKSVEQFKYAIGQNANRSDYHHGLGTVYEAKGMIDEAIEKYRKAAGIDRKNVDARSRLAHLFFKQKEYGKAEEQNREILKIDPRNSKARQRLVQLKEFRKKE